MGGGDSSAVCNERGRSRTSDGLQPCAYQKMGLSMKNQWIFITRVGRVWVGLRYHHNIRNKKYDDTPSNRFLNYRFKKLCNSATSFKLYT